MSMKHGKATRLTKPKATWLSLVPHAANRQGLKVVKEDKSQMGGELDLSKLGLHAALSAGEQASVFAVALRKADATPEVEQILQAAGFDATPELHRGTMVYRRKGEVAPAEDEAFVVQMTPEVSVVLKYFTPWSGQVSGFGEKVMAQSFGMSMNTAFGVAQEMIHRAMQAEDTDQDELRKSVTAVMGEATEYLVNLVTQLPKEAFIVPEDVSRELKRRSTSKADGSAATPTATAKEHTVKKPKSYTDQQWKALSEDQQKDYWANNAKRREARKKREADAKGKEGKDGAAPAKKEEGAPAAPAAPAAAAGAAPTGVDAMAEAIAKALKPMSDALAEVTQKLNALSGDVAGAVKKADDAAATTKAAVLAGAKQDPGGNGGAAAVKKAEPRLPSDSAFPNRHD